MTLSDPIADMLTRIRNGCRARQERVDVPRSKLKEKIAQILKDEGYIADFAAAEVDGKPVLEVTLKYFRGEPVIEPSQIPLPVEAEADRKDEAGEPARPDEGAAPTPAAATR